jgi:hypothetical protein
MILDILRDQKSQLDPVPDMTRILSPVGKEPMKTVTYLFFCPLAYRRYLCSSKAVVASLATIETTYAEHTSKGPFGWDHPDVPALLTAAQLLNATEGYLWVTVFVEGMRCRADLLGTAFHPRTWFDLRHLR